MMIDEHTTEETHKKIQVYVCDGLRLTDHPLSSSSSSSSTSSSGASVMAEDNLDLNLLRRARVYQENRHSLNSIQYKLSPVGLLIDLNHTCSCFTWASLVLPFFSSCFLSSSYFFRPSRYSATASLDGFFSSAETRKTSLLITNYSWSQ